MTTSFELDASSYWHQQNHQDGLKSSSEAQSTNSSHFHYLNTSKCWDITSQTSHPSNHPPSPSAPSSTTPPPSQYSVPSSVTPTTAPKPQTPRRNSSDQRRPLPLLQHGGPPSLVALFNHMVLVLSSMLPELSAARVPHTWDHWSSWPALLHRYVYPDVGLKTTWPTPHHPCWWNLTLIMHAAHRPNLHWEASSWYRCCWCSCSCLRDCWSLAFPHMVGYPHQPIRLKDCMNLEVRCWWNDGWWNYLCIISTRIRQWLCGLQVISPRNGSIARINLLKLTQIAPWATSQCWICLWTIIIFNYPTSSQTISQCWRFKSISFFNPLPEINCCLQFFWKSWHSYTLGSSFSRLQCLTCNETLTLVDLREGEITTSVNLPGTTCLQIHKPFIIPSFEL